MKKTIVALLAACLMPLMALAQNAQEVKSPDGNILLKFYLEQNGKPTYEDFLENVLCEEAQPHGIQARQGQTRQHEDGRV